MISFIVIGRNEEKNLERCFQSIFDTIAFNSLTDHEVIYVDSKSTDNSVKVVESFIGVKIFSIRGKCNAAIARNIGVIEACGNDLFFIDGDMAINREFLSKVIDDHQQLRHNLISGQIIDVYGDTETTHNTFDDYLSVGVFLIRKDKWELVGGMKTKYSTGEDVDIGLRLLKKKVNLERVDEVITLHYTVPYLEKSRLWRMFWDRSIFYSNSVLYRDHIFNKYLFKYMWFLDKTLVILVFFISIGILFPMIIPVLLCLYLLALYLRSSKQNRYVSRAEFILYYLVVDVTSLVMIFAFFPKNHKLKYARVR